MTTTSSGRSGDVQSVHRALDLLEAVATHREGGVRDLARAVGLNSSTVHNLLKTLARRGYLVANDGKYRLGPAATALTAEFDPALALPEVLQQALQEAAERTTFDVLSFVLVQNKLKLIAGARARPVGGEYTLPTGVPGMSQQVPALDPAAGRVLVAFGSRAGWESSIAECREIDPSWTDDQWVRELTVVTETGRCIKRTPEVAAAAVPVWAGNGGVIAAIGCSAPSHFVTEEKLAAVLDALWDTTVAVSAQLGCEQIPFDRPTVQPPVG